MKLIHNEERHSVIMLAKGFNHATVIEAAKRIHSRSLCEDTPSLSSRLCREFTFSKCT